MAELHVQYKANLDFVFEASAQFKYSPTPISLAKLRPLVNQALSSLSIIGIGLPLKATFGMDIRYSVSTVLPSVTLPFPLTLFVSMGVDFEFKAKMKATIGADAQCDYL